MSTETIGRPLSEAMCLVTELAAALHVQNIKKLPGPWIHKIDEHWTIALNGTSQKQEATPPHCMTVELEQFHMAVWWNGWLAALLTPFDGTFAAGSKANEDTFCEAVKAAIADAKRQRDEKRV